MSGKPARISDYRFCRQDRLLLDANVWIFVYGPNGPNRHNKVKIYSQAFRRMMEKGSQVYIDVLIISEFINRYARMKFELAQKKGASSKKFKEFRQSEAFKPIAKEVADATSLVLKRCQRVESGFKTLDIDALVCEYAKGQSDFNDQVIAEICRRERLKLVTDDSDFRDIGVPVLTENKTMLN